MVGADEKIHLPKAHIMTVNFAKTDQASDDGIFQLNECIVIFD